MRRSLVLVLLASLLPACGLKAPLYLPTEKPVATPPAAGAPVPATPPEDRKNPAPVNSNQ